jgi:hypothetical protein
MSSNGRQRPSSPVRQPHWDSFCFDLRLGLLRQLVSAFRTASTAPVARVYPLNAIDRGCGARDPAEQSSSEETC